MNDPRKLDAISIYPQNGKARLWATRFTPPWWRRFGRKYREMKSREAVFEDEMDAWVAVEFENSGPYWTVGVVWLRTDAEVIDFNYPDMGESSTRDAFPLTTGPEKACPPERVKWVKNSKGDLFRP